ncbi:MAG TPA: YafY family protein [Cytophagaceae bacterium]|jgi:predicted DNA-binding transcriptional regulator YafY
MNRIDRLLGVLTLLQSKKYTPAEKIADKYGISMRTVYRDMRALSEQGIPISFENNKGYFIVQGYFLPPVAFNSDEANALLLMEKMVAAFADRSIHTHYSSALDKIKAVLKTSQKEKLEFLQDNIRMQVPSCLKPDFEFLSVIQEAISLKNILQIEYKSNKEERSVRSMEPIGLIFYAFSWHLIGWCHLRKDYRDFKVSRLINIKNTGEPFTKHEHLPLSDYMKTLPVAY